MEHFSLGESLKIIHYEAFEKTKSAALQEILEFVGAPPHRIKEKAFETDYSPNKRESATLIYPPLTNETKAYLKRFYKPYNDELANLLGEYWRGVWD